MPAATCPVEPATSIARRGEFRTKRGGAPHCTLKVLSKVAFARAWAVVFAAAARSSPAPGPMTVARVPDAAAAAVVDVTPFAAAAAPASQNEGGRLSLAQIPNAVTPLLPALAASVAGPTISALLALRLPR